MQVAPSGTRLLLEVTAGARHAAFPDGFNEWRGRIGVRVRAPAQEGQANAEVVACVAAFFAMARSHVHLESGAQDSRKSLLLEGLSKQDVEERLQTMLEVGP